VLSQAAVSAQLQGRQRSPSATDRPRSLLALVTQQTLPLSNIEAAVQQDNYRFALGSPFLSVRGMNVAGGAGGCFGFLGFFGSRFPRIWPFAMMKILAAPTSGDDRLLH
jgi:hypothetical protein